MMASIPAVAAYTADELRTLIRSLETTLARGERTVTFADRTVTYASTAELVQKLAYFKGLLLDVTGGRSKQSFGYAAKGL